MYLKRENRPTVAILQQLYTIQYCTIKDTFFLQESVLFCVIAEKDWRKLWQNNSGGQSWNRCSHTLCRMQIEGGLLTMLDMRTNDEKDITALAQESCGSAAVLRKMMRKIKKTSKIK